MLHLTDIRYDMPDNWAEFPEWYLRPPTSAHQCYLLCHRRTRFWLVGPFTDLNGATEWGCSREHNPHDDPRWHAVWLTAKDISGEILTLAQGAERFQVQEL